MRHKTIILTRPEYEADSIKQSLMSEGFDVLSFPLIEIKPLSISEQSLSIFQQIADFKQIVFTSKNGVSFFFEQLKSTNDIKNARFACIGKSTAQTLEAYGFKAKLIGTRTAAEFLPLLQNQFVNPNEKLLLIQGKLADNILLTGLQTLCPTTRLDLYDTLPVKDYPTELVERVRKDEYELLLFTSPSAYHRFYEIMNENQISAPFRIACIGNTTAKAVRDSGVEPVFVARKSAGEEMVRELLEYIEKT